MTTSLHRPPRWSKKTDQLVLHVAQRCRPGLRSELAHWIESGPRFRSFLLANQDKVRKKLTNAEDEEGRLDVRAELLVAALMLADRRFELVFEAYGVGRVGPDLTVSFRTNQRFNLEVTRLRAPTDAGNAEDAGGEPGSGAARLANVIVGKLRQLPGDVPNALVIAARGLALDEDSLSAAARLLKMHTDAKHDAYFARRGFSHARHFHAQFLHLGGIVILDEATMLAPALFWPNREARHPLPKEAVAALMQCLAAAGQPLTPPMRMPSTK